nr:MAG TPA: hypothetical protein [Caudoviricetes sp.]
MAINLFKYHIQTETGKVIFYAPRYKFHSIRVTAVIATTESSERAAITPFIETILCYGCYYLVIYLQGCFSPCRFTVTIIVCMIVLFYQLLS